jgi:hypothetical protein
MREREVASSNLIAPFTKHVNLIKNGENGRAMDRQWRWLGSCFPNLKENVLLLFGYFVIFNLSSAFLCLVFFDTR